MRVRELVEKDPRAFESLSLEVLLDIRDLLKKEVKNTKKKRVKKIK